MLGKSDFVCFLAREYKGDASFASDLSLHLHLLWWIALSFCILLGIVTAGCGGLLC